MPVGMQAPMGKAMKKKPPVGGAMPPPPRGGMPPPSGGRMPPAPPSGGMQSAKPPMPPGMPKPSSPDGSPGAEGGVTFKQGIKDQLGKQLASGGSAGEVMSNMANDPSVGIGARHAIDSLMKKRRKKK